MYVWRQFPLLRLMTSGSQEQSYQSIWSRRRQLLMKCYGIPVVIVHAAAGTHLLCICIRHKTRRKPTTVSKSVWIGKWLIISIWHKSTQYGCFTAIPVFKLWSICANWLYTKLLKFFNHILYWPFSIQALWPSCCGLGYDSEGNVIDGSAQQEISTSDTNSTHNTTPNLW